MAYAGVEDKKDNNPDKTFQSVRNQSNQGIENDNYEQIKNVNSNGDKKRLIVKFDDQMTSRVEGAIKNGTDSDLKQVPFMSKYKMSKIQPLNQNLTQWKNQNKRSESAFTDKIKNKYSKRAGRYKGDNVPPKISGTYIVESGVTSQDELKKVMESIKKEPGVLSVDMDKTVSVQMTPDDPYFATTTVGYENLFNLKQTSVDKAWDLSMGEGITVAVIDTGERVIIMSS